MKKKTRPARKRRRNIGSVPGTMTYTGVRTEEDFSIEVIDYDRENCTHTVFDNVEKVLPFCTGNKTTWINVNGLRNVKAIETLGKHLNWHPLVLEDIVDTYQRPKIDEFEDYLFVVFKMLYYQEDRLVIEHLSLVMGQGYVVTFQEEPQQDVFDDLRKRIIENRGRVRNEKSDYLLFILLDAVTDHYFLVAETLGEKIEDIEDQLFEGGDKADLTRDILLLKKETLRMKRSVFPAREIVSRIEKTDSDLISAHIENFYRDLYDHAIQVVEYIEMYREMIMSLMEMYMSTISNRMNNIMKVLTVIATIFIPLTFIAGVYGMNFDNMPELHGKYSYFILMGVMLLIFIGMLLYFKRKKWL
ncbi:magnesium/cobalt transporter CorA [Sinomicrobium soli]|uniref:magnesium/cobalt transporter CorA n=1 Tax=Sinomicrobium sp. N-1-3-6 TaxID=2219864 RepID=UPI000DCBA97D|nr:magnesium/cobalt transporter CorA [Sinomicrobium sp. N-1-3-6]RAV29107.1 magnesium and cobalt transport protein CorA [Sinomicrobium sp. N-1-3-6]